MNAARRLGTLIVIWLLAAAALAEPQDSVRTLFDNFAAHRRVAAGYLRTGNAELAANEIDILRSGWERDVAAISGNLQSDAALATALDETDAFVRQALQSADAGDVERARVLLDRGAERLARWRKARGIRLFADCIAEIGVAYERLDRYRLQPLRLGGGDDEPIASAATGVETVLQRCDAEAPSDLRREPEFRRLIDGMLNSLRQIPAATRQRDNDYLYRLLIEQRSFERLLAFRYG
jgi:hypothetical protein